MSMTNHVTPQTARDLKRAGFKQPEQKPGQFWYLENRLYIIVAILTDAVGETAILYEVCQENREPSPLPVRLPFSDVFVYAPTAPDILQQLDGEYFLDFDPETEKFLALKSVGPAFKFEDEQAPQVLAIGFLKAAESDE